MELLEDDLEHYDPGFYTCYSPFPVKDEKDLKKLLGWDSLMCAKPFTNWGRRVVYLAGHFPLGYSASGAHPATDEWGAFTTYTLELACEAARDVAAFGRKTEQLPDHIGFILLADDINYEDAGINANFSRQKKHRMRNQFYKSMSGPDARLPEPFSTIFEKYDLPQSVVIRQNQGKQGRENSLFFSERILRAQRAGQSEEQACAQSYRGLLEAAEFNIERDYLIAFIPDRCTGNICDRVLQDPEVLLGPFAGAHITMQTDGVFLGQASKDSIWQDWGVTYRRDTKCI